MLSKKRILISASTFAFVLAVTGCSGGSNDVNLGGGDNSGGGSDTPHEVIGGSTWKVEAGVSSDTCGERISDVTQNFDVVVDGGIATVDTSITTISGPATGSGFTVGFEESNGDCQRSYEAEFSSMSSSTADVSLTSRSNCGGATCESHWLGSATRVN